MSKASEYALKHASQRPYFKDRMRTAMVSDDGDLYVLHNVIDKDQVPALIAWLQETFIDEPRPLDPQCGEQTK